jgi:hypothetical protein
MVILMIRCEGDDTSHNASFHNPLANPQEGPPAGNPEGKYPVPLEAGPEDVSIPIRLSAMVHREVVHAMPL